MSIKAKCRFCEKSYTLKDQLAGRKFNCKQCGKIVQIPSKSVTDSPPSSQPDIPRRRTHQEFRNEGSASKRQATQARNNQPRKLPPRREPQSSKQPTPPPASQTDWFRILRPILFPRKKTVLLFTSLGPIIVSIPLVICVLLYQKFVEPPERSLKPAGHVQPELSDEAGAPSPQETSTRTSSKPPVFNRVTYQKRRAAFTSNLEYKGPSPQEYETFNTPAGVEEVVYESEGLELKAWVDRRGASEEKSPAIVYFHGGFAIALSSIEEACAQFREAGFVVMCPTLRGENGNPGNFELFLGEVDDAANACRWLAQQDYVDQDRIYTFGHSVGGGISTLLSLQEDLPVAYTGSSGGLYSVHTFFSWREIVPFDWTSQSEKKIRILSGNIADMLTPHIAYIGTEDLPFHSTIYAVQNEKKKDSFLTVRKVHGDHFTSFDVAVKEYIKLLKALPKSSPAHTSEPETDRTGNQ